MKLYRVEVTETRMAIVYVLANDKTETMNLAEDVTFNSRDFVSMGREVMTVTEVINPSKYESVQLVFNDGRTVEECLKDNG